MGHCTLPANVSSKSMRPDLIKIFILLLVCHVNVRAYGKNEQIAQQLSILPDLDENIHKVDCLNRLADLYRGKYTDSCLYYSLKAKELAERLHYDQGILEADHSTAEALFQSGLYAESLRDFHRILPRYTERRDTLNSIRLHLDIANALNKTDSDKEPVINEIRKAIRLGEQFGQDSILARVYMTYCIFNTSLPSDSLRYYLARSRQIATRHNDDHILQYNKLWDLRLMLMEGRHEDALPKLQEFIHESRGSGHTRIHVNACLLMVGYSSSNPRLALDHCLEAYGTVLEKNEMQLAHYVLGYALEIAQQLGDKDEIIHIYSELEKSHAAESERSRKFMADYFHYNSVKNENIKLAARNAEKVSWIIIISTIAVILVLAVYMTMHKRNRKIAEQIRQIDSIADSQIISLEEVKHRAIREEQRRLAQELHDNLAGTLVSIKYQMESLSSSTEDEPVQTRINLLRDAIDSAYNTTRRKSHELYFIEGHDNEDTFEKQITRLLDVALPDNQYTKNVYIDDLVLPRLGTNVRITFLRIIQEGLTNIIKHAKASLVEIVIYEENQKIILSMKDNGLGFELQKSKKKSTIGLNSIARRVQELRGTITISSESSGTEIIVEIPVRGSL